MNSLRKEPWESEFLSVFVSPQRIHPARHTEKRHGSTSDDEDARFIRSAVTPSAGAKIQNMSPIVFLLTMRDEISTQVSILVRIKVIYKRLLTLITLRPRRKPGGIVGENRHSPKNQGPRNNLL